MTHRHALLPALLAALAAAAQTDPNHALPAWDDLPTFRMKGGLHAAWKAKAPLIRKLRVGEKEWLVLAAFPWQDKAAVISVPVRCGATSVPLAVRGRHTEICRIENGRAARMD